MNPPWKPSPCEAAGHQVKNQAGLRPAWFFWGEIDGEGKIIFVQYLEQKRCLNQGTSRELCQYFTRSARFGQAAGFQGKNRILMGIMRFLDDHLFAQPLLRVNQERTHQIGGHLLGLAGGDGQGHQGLQVPGIAGL